ncbi:MAG: hypothetical protein Q7T10_17960 [Rhodoferax sp.]|uniref:hypothetical protein n=1 Tax=Rhodoferax sp. TaxID=50421 RepID=UPI00271C6C94|nr:hypothetical protein [Rhodoferax sp.]MDO8450682.1 hypothetical protein [Rhodoferax sp.]
MESKPKANARGRPPKQKIDAAGEAAFVIEVALAIRLGRIQRLRLLGFTEATALRFVMKRRRGLTGEYIGTTVSELLGTAENKTQAALRLVTEHGAPVALAARSTGVDRRNLQKVLPEARQLAQADADRKADFKARTVVTDFNFSFSQVAAAVSAMYFLPRNTTP